MTRRTRHLFLPTCALVVAVLGTVAGGSSPVAADDPPDVVIDDFTLDNSGVLVDCAQPGPLGTSFTDSDILGGELDFWLACQPDSVGTMMAGVQQNGLRVVANATPEGTLTAVWDGSDNSPTLDATGLDPTGDGGIDLTSGGTKDSFTLDITAGQFSPSSPSATIEILVYTDDGHVSRMIRELPVPVPGAVLTVPFAVFTPANATPGADFTDVGAIQLNVVDSIGPDPFTLGSLETTTVAQATMADAVEIDADGDGQPTPGDTIEYTVTIANPADMGQIPAIDAVFTLASFDGAFVPGSVMTTPQGTVTTGNGPADTGVAVDLDNVLDGSSVTVTFQVVADAVGDLANQGLLTYTIPGFTTTNTATETDDPDTPAFSDDTVTAVVAPAPVIAADDSSETPFGTPVSGNVLVNDTGPGTLVATVVVGPTNGSLVLNPDGSFTYTPNSGFSGTDTFTYRATSSATNASDEGVITITVDPSVEPVVAGADSYETTFETPVSGNLLANDTGGAGPLVAELVDPPANGTLTFDPDGSFTYTPDGGFSGTDAFTYRASAPETGPTSPLALALPGDIGMVTITVAPPPDTTAPTTTSPTTTTPPTTAPGTVPPPPTTGPLAPTVPPALPATGSDSSGLAMTALLVFGLGAILTLVVRKRRHA